MTTAIARAAVQAGVLLVRRGALTCMTSAMLASDAKLLRTGGPSSAAGARGCRRRRRAIARLREAAGLVATPCRYPQHGVVCQPDCRNGASRHRCPVVLPDGSILALLPLPDVAGGSAVSMVWSTDPRRAASLCAMADDELLRAINAISGRPSAYCVQWWAGRAVSRSICCDWPTRRQARVLVVGDAAHTVHPLAGQGVNVGLADARCLFDLWSSVAMAADDPGITAARPLPAAAVRPDALTMRMTDGLSASQSAGIIHC